MLENDGDYTLDDLVRETGMVERTIRYYISNRLVPPPSSRGPRATYAEEHLLKLKLVDLLKKRMKLEEVRARLEGRSLQELQMMLAEERRRTEEPQSARDYIASLLEHEPPPRPSIGRVSGEPSVRRAPPESWLRLRIADGVELHMTPHAHDKLESVLGKITRLVKGELE